MSQVHSPSHEFQNTEMTPSQLNLSLATAKESRKRAELDAQLLANRIALLKQEEEKAWKKIEETRKKANEILSLRQQNEQKYIAKEEFYKHKYETIRQAQQQNAAARERAHETRSATHSAVLESKRHGAQTVKEMSMVSAKQRREREMLERTLAAEKSEFIRQQRLESKKRLQEEMKARQEHFRQQYESKIGREELLRARTEALVSKMEKEEMELISRLQNTQLIQRSAYDELEGALGATSQSLSATRRGVTSTLPPPSTTSTVNRNPSVGRPNGAPSATGTKVRSTAGATAPTKSAATANSRTVVASAR
eukprot:GDKK01046437.1.p1 GENE.GDKK01046437.1~~GDKK01046437.1.p1  ORF type:complete len:310 (+),score=88.82 GDKK01046437.1:39-968(+)